MNIRFNRAKRFFACKKACLIYFAAWLLLSITSAAFASDDLEVEYPTVHAGEAEVSLLGMAYSDDDPDENHAQTWRVGAGYGVTDIWSSELYAEYEKPADSSSMSVQFYQWENLIRLTKPGQYWADWAINFEYAYATDKDAKDAYEIMPVMQKRFNRSMLTLNVSLERNPTENDTTKLQLNYAWQYRWLGNPAIQFALEGYGKLGNATDWATRSEQSHQLGPVLLGDIHTGPDNILSYRLGYYFGLTDAATDRTLVLNLEYEL